MKRIMYGTPVTPPFSPSFTPKSIVFIDSAVPDIAALTAALPVGSEWVILQADSDGLEQMANYLRGRRGIDAIQVISHGASGEIQLGALNLDEAGLQSHQGELAAIGHALSEGGDLLLYGCNVAKGQHGLDFIGKLARATGADVAASNNLTGAADKGGDWVTEYHVGEIGVRDLLISSYTKLLSVNSTSVTVTASDDPNTEYYPLTAVSADTEFDNNGNPIDIDPAQNTISITYSSGASLDTGFDLVFQGGNLDHFTGISKTSSSGHNPNDVTATVSGKTIHFNVGNGGFSNGTIVFTFTSVSISTNHAPTVIGSATNPTFTENGYGVSLFTGVTAATNDSGQTFSGAVFTVNNVSIGSEYLTINGVDIALADGYNRALGSGYGTASVSKSGGTAIVTLSGAAISDASMQTLLSSMTYRNSSENPSVTARTVTLSQLTDSGNTNNTVAPGLTSQVTIHAVNDAPTAISLTSSSIGQSLGSNGTVGTLSATDIDSNSFSYRLVSGTGSTDNSLFSIVGNALKVNNAATMTAGSYSLRVEVSDGTDTYQQVFSITVSDDIRPTFDVAPAATNIGESGFDLSASLDEAGTIYYVIVADGAAAPSVSQIIAGQNASGATAIGSGSHVVSSAPYTYSFSATGLNQSSNYDVYVVAKDNANNQILSASKVDVATSSNSAPVFSNLNGGATYTENGSSVVIDSNVTITDAELDALNGTLGNYHGASISIARSGGASSNDVFGNSGLLGALTQGQNFTYNGMAVGSVTANSNGTLTLTFNSNATSAIVNAVLQSLTYANSSDDAPSSVTLNWTFNDGSVNSSGSNQAVLNITPVNDRPDISNTAVSKTFNEDAAQTFNAADFGFHDVDSGDTLQSITIVTAPTAGELFIDADGNGVRGVGDTLLGDGAVVSAANIGKLTFHPAADANGAGYAGFTWTVSDGTASSASVGSMTLNVTSVNDAPVISNTAVSKTLSEDAAQTFSAADFGFHDVDSGDTLQAIRIVNAPGAGELFIDANGDGVRGIGDTLIGNGTVLSAADLAKLTFRPAANASGSAYAAFTWTVSDGTASSANVGTMTLNVTAVNDAPTLSNGVTVTMGATSEDATSPATTVASLLSNAGYGDTDSGAVSGIALTALAGLGHWWYSTDSGTNWFAAGTVSGASALLLSSTAQIRYVPDSANGETATLTFKAWDATSGTATSGASKGMADTSASGGSAAFSANSAQASIMVTSVNDAPTVASAVSAQSATQDALFSFTVPDTTFVDVDSGDTLVFNATQSDGSALPAWLHFDPIQHTLSGTPQIGDVGNLTIRLTATDGSSAAVSTTFGLTVNRKNQAPVFDGGATAAINVAENSTTVTSVHATDTDTGEVLSYSITGGADQAKFHIDTSSGVGVLRFVTAPDYEAPTDADGNNSYLVQVTVSDGHGGSAVQAITVNVTNVAEGGAVDIPVIPPDNDGVSSAVEDAVPTILPVNGGPAVFGDGNGDGVADSQQSNVTSVAFRLTDKISQQPGATSVYLTLVADSVDGKVDAAAASRAVLNNVQQIDAPADKPAGVDMPFGMISFSADVAHAGATESFSLYVDGSTAVNGYWKQVGKTWVNLASADYGGKVVTEAGKTRLDFKITDGGIFDGDGKANGVILDPGAIGYRAVNPNDSDNDQFPDALEAAHGLTVGAKDNDVFASNKLFAMQLYRDVLYREAESDGLQFWQDKLDKGILSKVQVANAFLDSTEFQHGAGAITRLYFGALERTPDAESLDYWMAQYQSGQKLDNIAQAFSASAEFTANYGKLDDSAFVAQLCQHVLGRNGSEAEIGAWLGQMHNGLDRAQLLLNFTESAEYRVKSDVRVDLALDYVGLLGRTPDAPGLAFWTAHEQNGMPLIDIVGQFIASPEYHDRFLPPLFS